MYRKTIMAKANLNAFAPIDIGTEEYIKGGSI
jgi:hypothetical protein